MTGAPERRTPERDEKSEEGDGVQPVTPQRPRVTGFPTLLPGEAIRTKREQTRGERKNSDPGVEVDTPEKPEKPEGVRSGYLHRSKVEWVKDVMKSKKGKSPNEDRSPVKIDPGLLEPEPELGQNWSGVGENGTGRNIESRYGLAAIDTQRSSYKCPHPTNGSVISRAGTVGGGQTAPASCWLSLRDPWLGGQATPPGGQQYQVEDGRTHPAAPNGGNTGVYGELINHAVAKQHNSNSRTQPRISGALAFLSVAAIGLVVGGAHTWICQNEGTGDSGPYRPMLPAFTLALSPHIVASRPSSGETNDVAHTERL
ncbi:hypothetical protein FB45DRAFT_876180 [Roridomyces roridus]|uniref:Uncharacterized protein n=1 Tax=Roridomyces roridus TaxID=1738132 RepID=A0AAD7FBG8_9AGAR|nr:hypothetical protein FB45DRAFT_876180 [Roridomyces roridus]